MRRFSIVAGAGGALALGAILSGSSTVWAGGGSPPVITNVSWTYVVRAGTATPLQVAVSGTAPLSYQWQRNGVDIPDATNATYVFTPAHCRDSASIGVIVTNECGRYALPPRSVTAFGCLQELIDAAAPGDTLTLPATNYDDNVVINKNLTLEGMGSAYTSISGGYRSNTFMVQPNVTVTFRRLLIQSGASRGDCFCPAFAAGIHNFGNVIADQCTITGLADYTGTIGNYGTMVVSNSIVGGGGQAVVAIKNGGAMSLSNVRIFGNAFDDGGTTTIENSGSIVFNDCVIADTTGKRTSWSCIANGGTMIMTNVVIANNRSGSGGGITSSGNLILSRCSIYGNQALFHGIGAVENGGTALIEKSVIRGHNSGDGYPGGVANRGGNLTMIDCEISDNSAYYFPYTVSVPGGLYNASGATGVLVNCTISGNESVRGGAGIATSGYLVLSNCTVSGNGNANASGGIRNHGVLTIDSCTLFGNGGGGLDNLYSATLRNTIFASNSAGAAISGPINSLGYNLIQDTNGAVITNIMTGNLYGIDPMLGPLQTNGGFTRTHALLPGSAAIDAGPPMDFPLTDQRGFGRPVDGDADGVARADIGAYEFGHLRLAGVRRSGAKWEVRGCVGVPGSGYAIEASSDLWNWAPLSTNSADASGWFAYPVTPGDPPARFYRLRQP